MLHKCPECGEYTDTLIEGICPECYNDQQYRDISRDNASRRNRGGWDEEDLW